MRKICAFFLRRMEWMEDQWNSTQDSWFIYTFLSRLCFFMQKKAITVIESAKLSQVLLRGFCLFLCLLGLFVLIHYEVNKLICLFTKQRNSDWLEVTNLMQILHTSVQMRGNSTEQKQCICLHPHSRFTAVKAQSHPFISFLPRDDKVYNT